MNTLRALREKKGLTQAQLAELAETSQPQIKRLENGERELTVDWARRLAGPLGTTAVKILFPEIADETPADPEKRLRQALLAYGVDSSQLDLVIDIIGNFVPKAAGATQEDTPSHDQRQPASRHREPTP